jgi:hypothetical protein
MAQSKPWMMKTILLPLTEEEPGPRRTSQVDNHKEVTLPDEKVTNPE